MSKKSISPTHALLGLLIHGERYGYELKRTVDQEFAPYWRIDFAQLYRSLAKMTRQDWVQVHIEAGGEGPDRKVYHLTPQGRRALKKWLAELPTDRNEFFVKVRLANEGGVSVKPLVDAQRVQFENERTRHAHADRIAKETGATNRLLIAHAALYETEASLAALDFVDAVLPSGGKKQQINADSRMLVIAGSDDPLLAELARLVHNSPHPIGSLGGLFALAQHRADVVGAHLLDPETGEYNIPFVKHFLPEDEVVLINLAYRENGLLIARGKPHQIHSVRDLKRRDIRFINRARGTGTRLLLYSKLKAISIDPRTIADWDRTVATHDAVGAAIATGTADVGPGLRATAVAWKLDFIPLGDERYDLIIPHTELKTPHVEQLLGMLQSPAFRHTAETLAGYDLSKTGHVIARLK